MNKAAYLIAGVAMSAFLAGCGGTKEEVADCVFPDAPGTAAPGWVCDEPVEGVEVSAVGSADKSGAGHDFMKQMAATSARVQLAQRMKVQVRNMIKQYIETTGAADSETVDKVMTSVTKQITNETLVGTRIYKTRTSPTGSLYVLLGMDEASVEQATKNAVKTSMKNERALWQQFKAQKSQDELAAEISKMEGN
ncbi:MAG: LPP20 family lipoprotein [Gammaproteobacteria bacterium]|nr:LPP20 family lipoprotein [Gammaproteobacteria bacterium]